MDHSLLENRDASERYFAEGEDALDLPDDQLAGGKVTPQRVVALLRTMPRSTTAEVQAAVQEDIGRISVDSLRRMLNELHEAGQVVRDNRRSRDRSKTFYVWWVPA